MKLTEELPVSTERGEDYKALVDYAFKQARKKGSCELTNSNKKYFRIVRCKEYEYDVWFDIKSFYGRGDRSKGITKDYVQKVLEHSKFLYTKPEKKGAKNS